MTLFKYLTPAATLFRGKISELRAQLQFLKQESVLTNRQPKNSQEIDPKVLEAIREVCTFVHACFHAAINRQFQIIKSYF